MFNNVNNCIFNAAKWFPKTQTTINNNKNYT